MWTLHMLREDGLPDRKRRTVELDPAWLSNVSGGGGGGVPVRDDLSFRFEYRISQQCRVDAASPEGERVVGACHRFIPLSECRLMSMSTSSTTTKRSTTVLLPLHAYGDDGDGADSAPFARRAHSRRVNLNFDFDFDYSKQGGFACMPLTDVQRRFVVTTSPTSSLSTTRLKMDLHVVSIQPSGGGDEDDDESATV
jgi:hypothetical protein